jgi:hypothetical protein
MAGMHETVLKVLNGNTLLEFSSQLTTVLPEAFSEFTVWSANKFRSKSSSSSVSDSSHDCDYDFGVEKQCGLTKLIFRMKMSKDVPAFDDLS